MTGTPALAAALARIQAELPTIERDRTVTVEKKGGGEYSYSYVTLARLSEVVLPLLAKHGLSFTAMPGAGSDGKMCVRYALMHESGEERTGEFPISGEGGIQMIGGRITYARRYCLAAVVGIAADEDDESRLVDDSKRPVQRAQSNRRQPRQSSPAPKDGTTVQRSGPRPPLPGEQGQADDEPITKPQLAKVALQFNKIDGWSHRDDRLRAASAIVGRPLQSSNDLSKAEASGLIDTLEKVLKHDDPTERLTELVAAARERIAAERAASEGGGE